MWGHNVNKSDMVNRALMEFLRIKQLSIVFVFEIVGWAGVTPRITVLIWLQQTTQALWLLPKRLKF